MTFLQHYGLGAVGFTMLITTLTVQWSIIVEGIFLVLSDADAHSFPMRISFLELIDGNFAAATVLISFGALIGKVGPTQVVALALFEVVVYAANKRFLMIELIGLADIGGTVVIHCFGAYFGLAAAWVLGVPKDESGNSDSSSISDIFSLVGTVFLWLCATPRNCLLAIDISTSDLSACNCADRLIPQILAELRHGHARRQHARDYGPAQHCVCLAGQHCHDVWHLCVAGEEHPPC